MCISTHRKNTAFCDICGIFSHKIIKRVQKNMLAGYSEGIRKEEKEENGQKVNVNLVYCLPFTVYRLPFTVFCAKLGGQFKV